MSFKAKILKSLVLPVADRLMDTEVASSYRRLGEMRSWTREEVRSWQDEQLRALIRHAYENTRYYRARMDEYRLKPEDIRTIEDLPKLPVLTKQDILAAPQDFVPANLADIPYKRHSTGGSTGEPLQFRADLRTWSFLTAFKIRSWEHVGYNYGDPMLGLGSTSLFPDSKPPLKNRLYNWIRSYHTRSGVHLTDSVARDYVELIRRKRVRYLYGYASSLYLLARYCTTNHFQIKEIRCCFPTSEMLTDEYRSALQVAFDCEIMDSYGAQDGGIAAFEFSRNTYPVSYNSIVELEEERVVGTGVLLSTDLFNRAFPFIRYQVGDEVQLRRHERDNVYNGQIIDRIWGRVSDVMRLENGRCLTGPGFTILFRDLLVKSYRIRKVGPMHIELQIVRAPGFGSDEVALITNTLKKHAGDDCRIDLAFVENFGETASGKRNYFIT